MRDAVRCVAPVLLQVNPIWTKAELLLQQVLSSFKQVKFTFYLVYHKIC